MQWKKSSPALVELFTRVAPGAPAEQRQMFGYPAAFVNGNMFIGLYQEDFILRLPEDARSELLKKKGAHAFEPMAGRPMKEYVVAPQSVVNDEAELRRWISRSLQYVTALPAKKKKPKSSKKKRGESTLPRPEARSHQPGSCAAGAPNLVRSGRKQR